MFVLMNLVAVEPFPESIMRIIQKGWEQTNC